MPHICHEEVFALLMFIPFAKLAVSRLKAWWCERHTKHY